MKTLEITANLIFQYVIVLTGGLSEHIYLTLTGIADYC